LVRSRRTGDVGDWLSLADALIRLSIGYGNS
jgi:hypothetical protein